MPRACALAAVAVVAGACAAPPGDATGSDETAITDPGASSGARAPTLSDIAGLSGNPPVCASAECDAERARFFALLGDLGIHRLRFDLLWASVEPSRGRFDFSTTDRVVGEARAAGVRILGMLDYGAPWATSHHDMMYPPDDPNDFVAYASAVAKHYDGVIDEYEIWNEPNNGWRFWKTSWGGDARAFGDLATRTAAALRKLPLSQPLRIAPGGTVYLPELVVPAGVDFARDEFATNPGLASATNAFAFHAYDFYPPHEPPESSALFEVPLDDKIERTRAMLDGANAGARPLWLTEIGWPTANGVDENAQARWLVRSLLIGAAAGLEAVYLYTLYDWGKPAAWSIAPEDAFGIVRPDGSPKAAYRAIKGLLSVLGHHHVVGRVEIPGAPADVHVIALASATGKRAYAAWRADERKGDWTFTPAASLVGSTYAIDGTPTGAVGGAIAIGPSPVYIVEKP